MQNDNLKFTVKKASNGSWKKILPYLTGLPLSSFKNIPQPCPLCRAGHDRYRFDDKKGTGTYYCNVCGAGDGVSFLVKRLKVEEDKALAMISDAIGLNGGAPKVDLTKMVFNDKPQETRVLCPVPINVREPDFYHYKFGKPVKVWQYRNFLGHICFYIARFEHSEGKDVLPMSYCHYLDNKTKKMRYGWRWKGVTKETGFLRPLYNLTELLSLENEEKWVLVVEGEKAADAAQSMFPELVVVTWSGGTKSISLTDWSPLISRNIIIWPDHDEAGYSVSIFLYQMFIEYNSSRAVRMVAIPDNKPRGWDLADALEDNVDPDVLKKFMQNMSFSELFSEVPVV